MPATQYQIDRIVTADQVYLSDLPDSEGLALPEQGVQLFPSR
jgi:hypothetical protein